MLAHKAVACVYANTESTETTLMHVKNINRKHFTKGLLHYNMQAVISVCGNCFFFFFAGARALCATPGYTTKNVTKLMMM